MSSGGCQETDTSRTPGEAATDTGVPGWAAGTTAVDSADAGPAPTAFTACTVKVEATPLVSPLTVVVRTGLSVATLAPLGWAVTT
ncbi:hypothetical protein MXAN_7457 [Myxococcus xanthus DK 1622]|uniref:Uncharacterized protein n=1 Tax=Myxococcus xanthus (strain DK1622) TaxID=246197 RepID=Q1CVL0_MYXXD|nr:hypothetical protein MXAN_7457 [Myxococcus xanthus DK 1622]